ncbi:MAG: hypothetical protein IJ767_03950 [Bacteroidaceae bacterium]|nr:hypothetical protein [Bacteroidaceae bacterium]
MNFALYCCTLLPLMAVLCAWCVCTIVNDARDLFRYLREDDAVEVTATPKKAEGVKTPAA